MTTGDKTRIKKIRTDGWLTEDYTYDGQAWVNTYRQTVDNQESYPMETGYLYDTLGRVTEAHYPAQFGLAGNPRKVVAHAYDTASRMTQMTYGGDVQASDLVFNAAGQTTEIKIGEAGTNQVTEEYTFDPQTGLLTNQKATKNGMTTLLDLSYGYSRLESVGSLNGKTGHLTSITDNIDTDRNRRYEYDALGRLTKAMGGITAKLWDQTYTYDRYGNRTNVTATGTAADSSPIPIDGIPGLAYDNTTNRITTTGFEYDAAGNQIRALAENGVDWLLYEYDAANRLHLIKVDGTTPTVVEAYYYGSTNARLITHNNSQLISYASVGGTTLAEYIKPTGPGREWSKSYTYLGDKQLATITPNGSGGEFVEFNHPDRLGTRLVTNQPGGTAYEQVTLPFGTALNAESTITTNSMRFTSYDRSAVTGLDYAVNRTYDSKQGRFTQVDPIDMSAVDFKNPQTLNLYSYCGNDPVNHIDPEGLFWGFFKKIFSKIGKALKWIGVAAAIAGAIIAIMLIPPKALLLFKILTYVGSIANAASTVFEAFGLTVVSRILGAVGAAATFGLSFYNKAGQLLSKVKEWSTKAILNAVKAGATMASKTLSAFGHNTAGRILGLGASVAGFIGDGYINPSNPKYSPDKPWQKDALEWFKFGRSVGEQVATIAGKSKLASYIGLAGLIEDGFEFPKLFKGLSKFPQSQNPAFGWAQPSKLLKFSWTTSQIVSRVIKGTEISHKSFSRIDKVVTVR